MPDDFVSRNELSLVKAAIDAEISENRTRLSTLEARIEFIDGHGSRGIGALTTRMDNVVNDLAEVRVTLSDFIKTHGNEHRKDLDDRQSGRHWLIGTAIAGIVSMTAVITLLLTIINTIHH